MTDEFERASDLECTERAHALQAHQNRPRSPVPLCEDCGEHRCHVTALNVAWRFCTDCTDCAEQRLRSQ